VEGQLVVAALRQLKKQIPTLRKVVWDNPGGGYVGRLSVFVDNTPRVLRLSFSNLTLPSPNFIYTFTNGSWTEQEIGYLDDLKDALLTFNVTHALTTIFGVSTPTASDPIWDNLINYWPMDDPAGVTRFDIVGSADFTGSGSLGSVTGQHNDAATTTAGQTASAAPAAHTSAFSYSVWLKMTDSGATNAVFRVGDGAPDSFEFGKELGLWTTIENGSTLSSGSAVIADVWNHLVLTCNGTNTTKLYLNGALDITDTVTPPYTGDLRLTSGTGTNSWDELARFSVELSPTQVASLYNSGVGRFF
jgi:hypothetical protein